MTARVIQLTINMLVDIPGDDVPEFTEESLKYWIEESFCIANWIDSLKARVHKDGEKGLCSICAHAAALLFPDDPEFTGLDCTAKPEESNLDVP